MIEVSIGIGIDKVVVIGVEDQIIDLSMDKTIEKGLNMVRIIEEETSVREDTIEKHKSIEDKCLEEDIEVTMGIE